MSLFASDDSEDEQWLQNHKKHHQKMEFQKPEGPDWNPEAKKRARRRQPREIPIRVGKTMQECPHCHQPAPAELFRDTKCLACQIADFLGPTP